MLFYEERQGRAIRMAIVQNFTLSRRKYDGRYRGGGSPRVGVCSVPLCPVRKVLWSPLAGEVDGLMGVHAVW